MREPFHFPPPNNFPLPQTQSISRSLVTHAPLPSNVHSLDRGGYPSGMILAPYVRHSVFMLGLFLLVLSASGLGCAGRRSTTWHSDATLAGRGGEGGVLALWGQDVTTNGTARVDSPRILSIPSPQDQTYNLFWTPQPKLADLRLTVRMQARSGVVDQGGGPMWRVQNRDHYYICRANPLESNFRLYKVVGGVRTQLASVKVYMPPATDSAPGAWHTIEVTHIGDRITCTLDGASRLEVIDNAISQAGGVGVWTKADAVAWFDDFSATSATSSPAGK